MNYFEFLKFVLSRKATVCYIFKKYTFQYNLEGKELKMYRCSLSISEFIFDIYSETIFLVSYWYLHPIVRCVEKIKSRNSLYITKGIFSLINTSLFSISVTQTFSAFVFCQNIQKIIQLIIYNATRMCKALSSIIISSLLNDIQEFYINKF